MGRTEPSYSNLGRENPCIATLLLLLSSPPLFFVHLDPQPKLSGALGKSIDWGQREEFKTREGEIHIFL